MERQELEKLTRDYQLVQEQLQSLAMQREQFTAQKEDQKNALEELEKATGKVYLNTGGVIVEASKDEAIKKLKERQESVEMRLSIVTKQLNEAQKKEKSMRTEITGALGGEKGQTG